MGKMDGKIAVITGGGSGIGFGIAERFAADGAAVVLVGRRQQRLDEAVARIGSGASAISADMADEAQVKALFDRLDKVDILVTCAGGAVFGKVDELPPSEWKKLFDGRFFGQLYCCHYGVPKMPPGSAIVLCSGIAHNAAVPEYCGGTALCGAVNAMGRQLAVELAPKGIRVNTLSPGLIEDTAIESNLQGDKLMNFWQEAVGKIPFGRAGKPSDTAEAAYFLATSEYTSGIVIDVDGGWTAT